MDRFRTIAISDIHGCSRELGKLLQKVGYRPGEDRLILLGDYVDRGPDSCGVINAVLALLREGGGRATALRGNHDQRFLQCLRHPEPELIDKFLGQGGHETLRSYARAAGTEYRGAADASGMLRLIRTEFKEHVELLDSLDLHAEDEAFIYVHAGIDPAAGISWKDQPRELFMWIREPFHHAPVTAGKTVVFGHTRTIKFQKEPSVWFGGDKIGIDGGCSAGGRLNALLIDAAGGVSEDAVNAGESPAGR
ncbi:metallophosphoesterase family protein [Paenibacillus sp. P22]|uniref:metallophosphoesterase family protein n=1 Tax=Paenibacillus TaxID=44249 RepID=UPI000430AED6|nr:metallophosphoesterase family protein [Paenibacillus sp. P22]CDN45019.1 Metallophosphoesterase [Paenibacillus sp. P22]